MLVILTMTLKNAGNAPRQLSTLDVHLSIGGQTHPVATAGPSTSEQRPTQCGPSCHVVVPRLITPTTTTVSIATIRPGYVFTWRAVGFWVP